MTVLDITIIPVAGIGLVCALIAVLFRRPIEAYGFVASLIGYFVIGTGMGHVQHLERVWLAYLAFAVLFSCAVFVVSFPLAYVMRKCPSVVSIVGCLMFALLFGLVSGFADAWPDSDGSFSRPSFWESPWYGLFSFPGSAGDLITNVFVLNGADWQGGEVWGYWKEIVFWSGTFWLIASVAAATPIYFFTQRYAKGIR